MLITDLLLLIEHQQLNNLFESEREICKERVKLTEKENVGEHIIFSFCWLAGGYVFNLLHLMESRQIKKIHWL